MAAAAPAGSTRGGEGPGGGQTARALVRAAASTAAGEGGGGKGALAEGCGGRSQRGHGGPRRRGGRPSALACPPNSREAGGPSARRA